MPSPELPATAVHIPRPPLPTFDAVVAVVEARGFTLCHQAYVIDRSKKTVDAIGALRMATDPSYPETYAPGSLSTLFGGETVMALIAGFTGREAYRYRDLPDPPSAYVLGLALAGRASK